MENDVLKNKIAPWQEKGRWYHCKLNSDGSVWKILFNESDKFFSSSTIASTTYLVINTPSLSAGTAFIIDFKIIFHALAANAGGFNIGTGSFYRYMSNTRQDINLVTPSSYIGDIDLYIFVNE